MSHQLIEIIQAISAPSIADMMVLEVIRSQKKMRRRRASRRDKKFKMEALDVLQFSSGGGANRKGADDEASDDACSIMSEIDLESSISWTPDPRQQFKRRDEMYVDPVDDHVDEQEEELDYQEGEYDKEEEEAEEEKGYNAVDFDEQPSTLELQSSSQHLLDFSFEGDKNNSRKLLSSMGFIGFDEEDTNNASFSHTGSTAEVIEGETKASASLWAAGKKLVNATVPKSVKKEEPEIRKLEELLRLGFINEQQFQELEKEAKEEIERRKSAYKKEKDRRKRIAKKKKKAKLRALEARNASESQENETTNSSNKTRSSETNSAANNKGRGGAGRGSVQGISTVRGRGGARGRGSGDGHERGGRCGTRGGERGRGGIERGSKNDRGRGGAGRALAVRGRGGVERGGGGGGRGRGDRGRGGGAPRDSEGRQQQS